MATPDMIAEAEAPLSSLGVGAAKQLATTTKSAPQMQGISPRWLLRQLAWVPVHGGTYRLNRRLTYVSGDGRVTFVATGADVTVIPHELTELPPLAGFGDVEILTALAGRFALRRLAPGETLARLGSPVDQVVLVADGKIDKLGDGPYGEPNVLGTLAEGDHAGSAMLNGVDPLWEYGLRAITPAVVLVLERAAFNEVAPRFPALQEHLGATASVERPAANKYGESPVDLAAGHVGEPVLPGTFVEYELTPREYPLSLAQTVLRVHTRVADLFNKPMNQTEQQLRLTLEELKERQEHELVNSPDYGLLHNAALNQRFQTRSGPPAPDDLDELLSRRRRTDFMLAHPRAIAAFRCECSALGVYPDVVTIDGSVHTGWRGVPLLPCDKIPISARGTSSVLALRTGEEDSGVIGLRPDELPDETEPGISVRFTGIDERAVINYLVSGYQSAAVLVPDALGVLENVEIGGRR